MESNIPSAILTWLKNNGDMLFWDAITSLPLGQVNEFLLSAYERRVADQTIPSRLRGTVEYSDLGVVHELDNYRVDTPLFSLESTSYNKADVKLSIALEQGAQAISNLYGEVIAMYSHRTVNPLQPLLELPMEFAASELKVDMRNATAFKLSLGAGDLAPNLGQRMAEQMFKGIAIENSSFTLAQVLSSSISPVDMKIRSQTSTSDSRQAVLLFMAFGKDRQGHVPTDGSGFPALFSQSASDEQTCTTMLSAQILHQLAYRKAIQASLEEAIWTYETDPQGRIIKAQATEGYILVPAGKVPDQRIEFETFEFRIHAGRDAQALTVDFNNADVEQTWKPRCTVTCRYRPKGGSNWINELVTLEPELNFRFTLQADTQTESGRLDSTGTVWSEALPGKAKERNATLEKLTDYSIRRGFINDLSMWLHAKVATGLLSVLRADNGKSLQVASMEIPGHMAVQGTFERNGGALRIVQRGRRLAAGDTLRFTTQPARTGIEWSCGALPDYPWNTGSIDPISGDYLAPASEELQGNTQRVNIVAYDPASGQADATQLTVLGSLVNVSPALQVLEGVKAGAEVQLHSFQMAQHSLDWSLVNVEGGAGGELSVAVDTARYTATAREPDIYCSIDKVVVVGLDTQGRAAGRPESAVILRRFKDPEIIVLRAEAMPEEGSLQLEGWYQGEPDDVEWYLPLQGPGTIDDNGLYRADPDAPDSYVIIRARKIVSSGEKSGHIIVPLPLQRFENVRAMQLRYAHSVRLACSKNLPG